MRPSASAKTRPIIFAFILAIGINLTLPHFAFGAARSFGGSGRFKGPKIQRQQSFLRPFHDFDSSGRFRAPGFHRHDFFSHPFNGFGFVGVGGLSEQPVIIIQQFQPAAATDPMEPAKKGMYVQPRWVDGGYGV
jgi:hypothetical protein